MYLIEKRLKDRPDILAYFQNHLSLIKINNVTTESNYKNLKDNYASQGMFVSLNVDTSNLTVEQIFDINLTVAIIQETMVLEGHLVTRRLKGTDYRAMMDSLVNTYIAVVEIKLNNGGN